MKVEVLVARTYHIVDLTEEQAYALRMLVLRGYMAKETPTDDPYTCVMNLVMQGIPRL